MKILAFLGLFFLPFTAASQVWFENFTAELNGATSGTAAGTIGGPWTTTLPTGGAASFSRFDVGAPYGGVLRINQTVNEGVWQSNVMNISALGEVALEGILGGQDATAADYVRAYYKIDGGPEILFGQATGTAGVAVFTASSAVVSGTILQIVIRGMDNSAAGIMGFDDITVTDISTLYSIASTDWNLGTTWSTVGFFGAACGCTPNATSRAIIGNNRTVNFTASANAAGVEIQSTGTLRWTANTLALTIERGGALDVQNGGTLTQLATTGSSIIFQNYTYAITVAGTLNIGLLDFNSSSNSTITNSGTLTLTTNPISLDINGTDGYVITNTGTFNLVGMTLGNGNLTVNNSGTINQTGNFTGVDAGSAFNNLSGGTWNFSGTTITNVRLFASNNSNTFNYSGVAQSIITPQDSYSNLTLSGSGAKTALANFSVRGNWTRSGTATFAPGGFRVTLTGTIAQTIAAVGGETFASLTINNSFATTPQITLNNPVTISTNLTMLDGNVNLNGNAFTITPTTAGLTHTFASTAGWMYGGNLIRTFPTTAILITSADAFFPLGDNGVNFRPFIIAKSNIAGSNGTITISHSYFLWVTIVAFTDNGIPGPALVNIVRRHDSFWTVAKSAGMIAGTFDLSAGGTGYTIGNLNEIRLTRFGDALGIGTAIATAGLTTDVRANRTGLTFAQLNNNFHIASTNAAASPLPILLAYFHAEIQGDEVISTWKTVQEKNNRFFTVQKTIDFETFYEIGTLDGQGDSQEQHSYTFADDSPFLGKSYYRLKQTDYDGKFTFSDPVMIDYKGPATVTLRAYPNPSNGRQITLELKGLKGIQSVPVSIYNQQGQRVMDFILYENGPGNFKEEIFFPTDLPQGVYVIKAGRTLQMTRKMVVDSSRK